MSFRIRHTNRIVIWLCIILLPPLGMILLWMRRDSRLITKLLQTLAVIVLGILHLFLFWGLRLEMGGGMTRPFFSFKDPRKHHEEIEKLREAEQSIDASEMRAAPPEIALQPSPSDTTDSEPVSDPSVFDAYWSEYRGPGRTGIYTETDIVTDWPADGLPLLWKRPVGAGYSSVVAADNTVFTIEQRRQKEVVAAYDLESGGEKWIHGWDAHFQETLGGDGPRATPTWHEGQLYVLGATGEFRCLDARSGSLIWSCNILDDNRAQNLKWGMAASPLIVDDKVIVLPGGSDGKSVVAYNRLTGDPVWKALDDKAAYTSPQLATLAGKRQILVVSASRFMGLSVEDGSLLWEYPWITYQGICAAQPIVMAPNRVFLSAGYDQGAVLLEISSEGDVYNARPVWLSNRMKNRFSSSIMAKGYIYGFDESIFACIDAATGERKWKGGRYGYGQVLFASDHLIISTETGEVVLVKATPEKHNEIARFPAIEGKTWNVPAIVNGKLIVRNRGEMACFLIGI